MFEVGLADDAQELLKRHSIRVQGLAELLVADKDGRAHVTRVALGEAAHEAALAELEAANNPSGTITLSGVTYDMIPDESRIVAAVLALEVAALEDFEAHQDFVGYARSEEAKLRNTRSAEHLCTVCAKPLGRLNRVFGDSVCGRCSLGGVR